MCRSGLTKTRGRERAGTSRDGSPRGSIFVVLPRLTQATRLQATMLKTILVGLNGSTSGRAATATALAWAKQHNAQVIGLAVADSAAAASTEFDSAGHSPFGSPFHNVSASSEAHSQAESLLVEFERSCLAAGVIGTKVHEEGVPGGVLLRHSHGADLLFVGLSRTRGGSSTSPLSPTLERVLTNAVKPVVCVPPTVMPGEAVVIAYDGSVQAACTLFAFVGLELLQDHPIHLIAVEEVAGLRAEALALAERYLIAHKYQARAECLAVQRDGVAATLLQRIATIKPKLVVTGVFGTTTQRIGLCGSVTRSLLHEVNAPIFLYH